MVESVRAFTVNVKTFCDLYNIVKVSKTGLWEGYRESRRCSRDTYPESYITSILVYEDKRSTCADGAEGGDDVPDHVVQERPPLDVHHYQRGRLPERGHRRCVLR